MKDSLSESADIVKAKAGTNEPLLSVVLPADGIDSIRGVLNRLRNQTLADQLEIVIATPRPEAFDTSHPSMAGFGWINVVELATLESLGHARAQALKAARARYAFLGETHSFADQPDWAAHLVARHQEGWAVVVPGFHNANPGHVLSWAGFLLDYGGWTSEQPAGEVSYWPLNNSSCDCRAVLDATDDPGHALSYGDQMLLAMEAAGHRVWFEPRAALSHLNIRRWRAWADEHWTGGHLVASYRSRDWKKFRRLSYAAAAPAIALVLMARALPGAWHTIRHKRLSLAILPIMFAGTVLKATGEAFGYLGLGTLAESERRMTEYELNKRFYA